MLAFVMALPDEARPFIRYYRLRQESRQGFLYYTSSEAHLIISGTGKIASAIATTILCASVPLTDSLFLVHYSFAAASKKSIPGTIFHIHQITEHTTGKTVYPDMIWNAGIPEASLITVDQPVRRVPSGKNNVLYDMEGYGFYQSAMRFLDAHQIAIFKTVSDQGYSGHLDRRTLQDINENAFSIVLEAVEKIHSAFLHNQPLQVTIHEEPIRQIAQVWRLTATQFEILKTSALAYKIRHRRDYDFSFSLHSPANAWERNQWFNQLLYELDT